MRFTTTARGVEFKVRAKPRSARDGVKAADADALVVQTTAPPADGEANARIVRILAEFFGVARSAVTIASGASGRSKKVQVDGIDAARADALVRGIPAPPAKGRA